MALRHWLQLTLTEGIGPITARRIVAACGSAHVACSADADLLNNVEGIGLARSRKIARALRDGGELVDREIERCARNGISLISMDDPAYPELLKAIPDPPGVLFVRGTLEPRDLNSVGIVGSRRCSMYGREQAERFGGLLAGAGFTVVSGGARGIDSAAHRGALAITHGRTLAVLGSGLDVPYPPENAPLFDQIARGRGAVLSEFPTGTPPHKENFPRRNRIVSGLSRGVLVVEADERSGALITARQAGEDHGRPVFALPGRVDNPLSAGPHALIRDGATLVARLEDLIEALDPLPHGVHQPELFPDPAPDPEAGAPADPTGNLLTDRQRLILRHLSKDAIGVDILIERTALPAHTILQELTFLTLRGQVRREDGQNFSRR